MPFKNISELPKGVQGLPSHAKRIWMKAFNSAYEQYGKNEERAAKVAWAAVKKVYKKEGESWVKKSLEFEESTIFAPIEFKSQDGNFYFRGYLATDKLDAMNDIVTKECLFDMKRQIDAGISGYQTEIKGSLEHDAMYHKIPISKITNATLDEKGLLVEGIFNKSHDGFTKIWDMVQNKFLDGLSIEFKALDWESDMRNGQKVRKLKKVILGGYGHTARPVNPECSLVDFFKKSLDEAIAMEAINEVAEEGDEMEEKNVPEAEPQKIEPVKVEPKVEPKPEPAKEEKPATLTIDNSILDKLREVIKEEIRNVQPKETPIVQNSVKFQTEEIEPFSFGRSWNAAHGIKEQ